MRSISRKTTGLWLGTLLAVTAVVVWPAASAEGRPLEVDVWTCLGDDGSVRPGEPVDVYFEVSRRARVIVYAIDTGGWVHVLYPSHSRDDGCARAGRTYRVSNRYCEPLRCGGGGVVVIGAVAARERYPVACWFDRGETVVFCGEHSWCLPECPPGRRVIGRVVGDPFEAVWAVEERLVPHQYRGGDFSTDICWYWRDRDPDVRISLGLGIHWTWPRHVVRTCVRTCCERAACAAECSRARETSYLLKWKDPAVQKPEKEWNKTATRNVLQGRQEDVTPGSRAVSKKDAPAGKPEADGKRPTSVQKDQAVRESKVKPAAESTSKTKSNSRGDSAAKVARAEPVKKNR